MFFEVVEVVKFSWNWVNVISKRVDLRVLMVG